MGGRLASQYATAPGTHICGKTSPIWNDLADAGLFSFSIYNCEDLAVAKATAGD